MKNRDTELSSLHLESHVQRMDYNNQLNRWYLVIQFCRMFTTYNIQTAETIYLHAHNYSFDLMPIVKIKTFIHASTTRPARSRLSHKSTHTQTDRHKLHWFTYVFNSGCLTRHETSWQAADRATDETSRPHKTRSAQGFHTILNDTQASLIYIF